MERNSLNSSLTSTYSRVDRLTLTLKAAVIGVCSSVDRFFYLTFGMNLSDDVNEKCFEKIKQVYPNLSNLTLDQAKRYFKKINQIRNLNAHLYKTKAIKIDRDLEEYFKLFWEPEYPICVKSELTIYGQYYVLSFVANKYDIWKFVTEYFEGRHIAELEQMNSDKRDKFRKNLNRKSMSICGIAKPLYKKTNYESLYMNNMFRKHLTKIIFEIEKAAVRLNINHCIDLKDSLENISCLKSNREILNLICFLRNRWFHGSILGDIVIFDGDDICFDFEFVLNSFIRIKRCLSQEAAIFRQVIDSLNSFAQACLNYFVLRVIEVTYKLLDKRLLTEDKFKERIQNLNNSYDRFINANYKFYLLAEQLLEPKDMEFYLNGKKFTDGVARITRCNKLQFVNLNSETGFDIGPYHIDQKEISFVMVNLEEENQYKINNKFLREYIQNNDIKIGTIFSLNQTSI